MPFYRMDLKDGTSTMVHMRLDRRSTPAQCGLPDFNNPDERCMRMATFLCDYPIAAAGDDDEPVTCDRPMCERHRTNVGKDATTARGTRRRQQADGREALPDVRRQPVVLDVRRLCDVRLQLPSGRR